MNDLKRELDRRVDRLPEEHLREVLDFARSLARKKKPPDGPSVEEEIETIVQKVPDDAWKGVPADGAEEHDHYIYGTPKRNA
ncbi:MAG: hypothetical protein BRD37_01460 [Bacteroidetes bacterium QH_8_67_23]|nr:MAG: hypothetical protein BRD37_01460 [Bacteroidetes bacterium QH_8_67_23]